ncbi:MAG: carbamoyltransferase HypF [Thermoanaerobaculia bacterium]|nr:carbamoyltransferase HypF [Thermoanaerobaculia bacterium]
MPLEAPSSAGSLGPAADAPSPVVLLRLEIRGAVQGVGFRPFVYRLARELALDGWVRNDSHGVEIEIEGPRGLLETFVARLALEKPSPAFLQSVDTLWLAPVGHSGFAIRESEQRAGKSAVVLPDLATCAECRSETFTPGNRRHRYPFTNCTHCGPRFSIVLGLPYDRPATTMRGFALCPACRDEYEDPASRRFHAQPNACPECGPQLLSTEPDGRQRARGEAALADAVAALTDGAILALKGIGGYQLLCDARSTATVARLRERKRRPAKALALMVRDVAAARELCTISPEEAALLASPQAPIALLRQRTLPGRLLATGIAPGNPRLGLMLPTSPLHHLLLAEVDFPVVATSGNLTDEPIAIDDREALERLAGIADRFLLHDRPIARHVDDSVAWFVGGAPQVLRRARGYAPLPIVTASALPCAIATGAHQKAAAALSLGRQVFLSQHLGDMETPEAHAAFERVVLDFLALYAATPVAIAHDLHPDYPTTRWAQRAAQAQGGLLERAGLRAESLPLVAVQHHHAHLASCLAENHGSTAALSGAALGLCFDGTGYGPDGTVWGGEALVTPDASAPGEFFRLARLRPFRLPGGEAAVREPRRIALALLHELEGTAALERADIPALASFQPTERAVLARMLGTGWNAPWTSSMGRLFDGVAALLGVGGVAGDGSRVSFEGEAAMALEFAADPREFGSYPLPLIESAAPAGLAPGQLPGASFHELDWRPLIAALLADRARGEAVSRMAARFHQALVDGAQAVARLAGSRRGGNVAQVALSGGCFQNRLLAERLATNLEAEGFHVLLHRAVPPNDGGIALGQIAVAAARLAAH